MKIIISTAIILIILGGIGSTGISLAQTESNLMQDNMLISPPIIQDAGHYVSIESPESDTSLFTPGNPLLPVITKRYTFPLGTTILDIDVQCDYEEYILSKNITPALPILIQTKEFTREIQQINPPKNDQDTFLSFPQESISITRGAGVQNKDHVLFVNVHIAPQWYPTQNMLRYPKEIEITIEHQLPSNSCFTADDYDLLIIAPSQYSSNIQPLLEHKNTQGVRTYLKNVEDIYSEYTGKDAGEQIKTYIKESIEQYGIDNVLLIGDHHIIPMRSCANTVITGVINWHYILSDLYYADIYDSDGAFSTWDTNNNQKYCECSYDYRSNIPDIQLIDTVDLYPDIGVGRIPCTTPDECDIIVDKIIHYETDTRQEEWFNTILLLGGDTTPDDTALYEGEWLHEHYSVPTMIQHGFTPKKLFTSTGTFTPETINQHINTGAGFLNYAGHGFMDSIGTFTPQSSELISYALSDIQSLSNDYKLPICFFDACLTGKIDYDLFDKIMIPLIGIYPHEVLHFLKQITDTIDTNRHFPCFAGSMILKPSGGGIAAIAATQPALSGFAVDGEEIIEIIFGSSNLNRYFFESYTPGCALSTMTMEAQNRYIDTIRSPESMIVDYVTLTEFNLFGDPSLQTGGYY